MATIDKSTLINHLSPPLDSQLLEQLLDEFVSMERRYVLCDWEPATLDGGQFVEAASRLIYHQDSGNLNRRRSVKNCLKYVEDFDAQRIHNYPQRKSALHSAKVLRTVYKFRSDRGAIHIDPEYTANHVDSKLVLENTRWILSEILRVFWNGDRTEVARTIREIVQYDIPVVGEFEGRLLVQRTDCTAEEEILILLYHIGEQGLSRTQLGQYVHKDSATVTRAIRKLGSGRLREIIQLENGNYRLTDLGIQRVLGELAEKLTI